VALSVQASIVRLMTLQPSFTMPVFDWNEPAADYAESLGLTRHDVEMVACRPRLRAPDPSTPFREWKTERRSVGDLTVIVTLPPGRPPLIWGVYLNLPLDKKSQPRGAGQQCGSQAPASLQALRKRIIAGGLRIVAGGRHDRVETREGTFVAALPKTPSDHRTVPNVWQTIQRKGYAI
jgi:hypothetical protein